MFTKIIATVFLIAAAHGRVLQVRNFGAVPLIVSVTGQSDLTLLSGATALVTVEEDFSGSISAVPSGSENSDVPRTKAQLTLSATGDSYAVSLIDGFNLKAKIVPVQGINCSSAVCAADLTAKCPLGNQVVNSLGAVVACSNSPIVFKAICPKAVVSADDITGVLTCQATSYLILLG